MKNIHSRMSSFFDFCHSFLFEQLIGLLRVGLFYVKIVIHVFESDLFK